MQTEPGDDYIRKTAAFIRANEQRLADAGFRRRKAASEPLLSAFNPLGWVGLVGNGVPRAPLTFEIDTHHLFYLLMRLEGLGIDVGSLDVHVDNPARPMTYIHVVDEDKSETLSIASFRSSFSAISKLSLGASVWGYSQPPNADIELKYIFSCFTKLPSVSIRAPGPRVVTELAQDPPTNNAIPVDSFRNLHNLECLDIDPRTLLGWDRLADTLRSLTIKRSGVDDPTTVFIDAVLDDAARREGRISSIRSKRLARSSKAFDVSMLPETVREESEERSTIREDNSTIDSPLLSSRLSPSKWARLKYLSLAENALTFIPSELLTCLTSLSHLDLSSNLLVSMPTGLSSLHNLISLNLSDNMIDSVLGVYKKLGQVPTLNLSKNRLESLCGLERLLGLERIDLRSNNIEDIAEVSRLATLPHIKEVWVEDNSFAAREENYRVKCFDFFFAEGKNVLLDGSAPGMYERRKLSVAPSEQMTSSRPPSAAFSPQAPGPINGPQKQQQVPTPTVASSSPQSNPSSPPLRPNGTDSPSPGLHAVPGKPKKRKNKRVVDLDGTAEGSEHSLLASPHSRPHSRQTTATERTASPARKPPVETAIPPVNHSKLHENTSPSPIVEEPEQIPEGPLPTSLSAPNPLSAPKPKSRHSRYHTEYAPSRSSMIDIPSPTADDTFSTSTSAGNEFLTPKTIRQNTNGSLRRPNARSRRTASVFEDIPPPYGDAFGVEGVDPYEDEAVRRKREAEAFRARIEALQNEVGENWLQVFSQSQFAASSPGGSRALAGTAKTESAR